MTTDKSTLSPLSSVPSDPLSDGKPAFGTYVGRSGNTTLDRRELGISRLRMAASEKRWQWFTAFGDEVVVGGAIVDAGFFGTAFLWVFDRTTESLAVDADVIVPAPFLSVTTHPTVGHMAGIDLPRRSLSMEQTRDRFEVTGAFGGADLLLSFRPEDDRAITAICPVDGRERGLNITQKEPGVPVSGRVSTGARTVDIDGIGLLDYSHGVLGRETRWNWAFAHGEGDGQALSFNLVDSFNDGLENVVWVDGVPHAVGPIELESDDSGTQWRVTSACGTVDATLSAEGRRREDIDIGLIRSFYDQPFGQWEGTVAGHSFEGVGVAEDHRTRW